MSILALSSAQPYSSTRYSRISASFTPCKGLLGCVLDCSRAPFEFSVGFWGAGDVGTGWRFGLRVARLGARLGHGDTGLFKSSLGASSSGNDFLSGFWFDVAKLVKRFVQVGALPKVLASYATARTALFEL